MRMRASGFSARLKASTPARARVRARSTVVAMSSPLGTSSSTVMTGRVPHGARKCRSAGVTGCGRGGAAAAHRSCWGRTRLAAAQGFGQGLHMGRAGAAAAADQAGAGIGHVAAQGGKVVRGGQVQGAAVDPLGEARVGKGRQRPVGGRRQAPQDQEQFARPGAAVGADGGRARGGQLPRGLLDAQAVAGEAALDEGQLGNGRQAQFPGNRPAPAAGRTPPEKVSSRKQSTPPSARAVICSRKAVWRVAVSGSGSLPRGGSRGPTEPATKRSGTGGFAGEPDPGPVDRGDLVLEAVGGQAQGIGAEGVGLEQLGAGGRVVGMHLADQRSHRSG